MSDPAWVGAGRGDSVGTATIATDGTFTIVAHGVDEGTPVEVDTLSGGATSVLREDATYFAINVTTDTFQLVSALGDEIITFGTTGGADVYTRVPHMLAIELRRLDSGLLTKDGDRFGAREGIHPACDPAVTVAGTTWTVENIVGVVYPAQTSTSGPYRFAHPTESGSLDPADGSNDRLDALDLQIQDNDEDSSGFRRARAVYVAGTPAADPDPPAQTANSLRLTPGGILVPAGGTPSPSVQSPGAPFTVASGGLLPVRDDNEGPASPYHGQVRYRQDTDRLEVWDGSAWVPIAQKGGWETIFDAAVSGDPTIAIDDEYPAGTFDMIRLHVTGSLSVAGEFLFMQVNGDATSGLHQRAYRTSNPTGGGFDDDVSSDGNVWQIARWSGADLFNVGTATIYNTDQNTRLSYLAEGLQFADTTDFRRRTEAQGHLSASRLLNSIRIGGTNSTTLDSGSHAIIEGHRPLS